MIKKKHFAKLLVIIYIIANIQIDVFANAQNPVTNLYDPIVSHKQVADSVTGRQTILPSVELKWEAPKSNPMPDVGATTNDKLNPDYYEVVLKDVVKGTQVKSGEIKGLTVKLENEISGIKNGTLYNAQVMAHHEHTYIDDLGNIRYDRAPHIATSHANAYFITDFDTQLKGVDGKLEISWEYIQGIEYRVGYAQGNYPKKELFPTNKVEFTVTESDITVYKDTETGGQRAKITLSDGIVPGQIYSAYVYPRTERTNDNQVIYANKTSPKVAIGVTEVSLRVYNIGKDKIRLEWNIEPEILQGQRYQLIQTQIYEQTVGSQNPNLITTLHGIAGAQLGYYEYREPKEKAEYYAVFIFQNIVDGSYLMPSPETNRVLYTPHELREKPVQPKVPKPANENAAITKDHLVTNDDVYDISHTFHAKAKGQPEISIVWDAPYKINDEGNKVVEYEMLYDIWVSDNLDILNSKELPPVIQDLNYSSSLGEDALLYNTRREVVGFKKTLSQYYTQDGQLRSLNTNKTYYIKLVAKRPYGDSVEESLPTIVSITYGKDGDIFVPPVLGRPPLRLKEVTKDTATLQWLEKWYEIISNNPLEYSDEEQFLASQWNSKVYTGSAKLPPIRFMASDNLTEHILKTKTHVEQVKNAVKTQTGDSNYYGNHYYDRSVELGKDTKYEVKVVPYDTINQQLMDYNETASNKIGIEEWIAINESDSKDDWQDISPSESNENDGLTWKEYKVTGLSPNTRYVLLIRAYRIAEDGTKQKQTYPSYVMCTTLSDYIDPAETPKVPELYLEGKTDTSISVWWTYNSSFEYEIVYSRKNEVKDAEKWEFTISDDPRSETYLSDGSKAVVTITGLFPDTTYNIWIRAKQKVGDKVSAWSNPVTAKTDILPTPLPPTGLGIAAKQSIIDLGLDFAPLGKDYITVEWTKDPNDNNDESADKAMSKEYQYIAEFADNAEFLDSITVTTKDENNNTSASGDNQAVSILSKTMIRFNGLSANKHYYVRVKTVLIYKDPKSEREIIRESEFTESIRILTQTSDDEYDGGGNDNIVIYEEAIKEGIVDGVWTWEILDSNKVISDIIKRKEYFFTINLQRYKNRTSYTMRRINIPKPVMDALTNQKKAIKIRTELGIYEIPATAIAYYTAQGDAKDTIQFGLQEIYYSDIATVLKDYPEVFVKAEKLTIGIKGKNYMKTASKADGMVKVSLTLDGVSPGKYNNINAYNCPDISGVWVKENHTVDTINNSSYITFKTQQIGTYALFERQNISIPIYTSYSMNLLQESYTIRGLGSVYKADTLVHSNQYINLLLGLAQNKQDIDLTADVSQEVKAKVKTIGLYVSSNTGYITQEQALNGVVKLYELKTGYKIKPSTKSFNNVSKNYRESAAKAYAIGLITDIDPQAKITYRQLCDWLMQVN